MKCTLCVGKFENKHANDSAPSNSFCAETAIALTSIETVNVTNLYIAFTLNLI